MSRRATTLLVLSFLATQAQSDSITFSVNLIVTAQEATSIGHATYDAGVCLDCRMLGNHRINGGSASYSWNLPPTQVYERQLSQAVSDAACYTGFIEGWGAQGFYGSTQTIERCAPCVLALEAFPSGTGTISGATMGVTSHDCGTGFTLSAAAASGWTFDGWTGSIASQSATISFTLDASKSLTANFVQPSGPPCTTCVCTPQGCNQSESCPLILDLNGDGIHTTGLDDPLRFWIDLQGRNEATAWTDPNTEEAFLWMDLNNDHSAQVTELFGSRMTRQDGQYHPHGFDALAKYDAPYHGGDGDGQITQKDWVWARLKLWVDRNHDGVSQPTEISVPASHRIVALNLAHDEGETYDEHGNELYLVGSYVVRTLGNTTELRLMADIEFQYIANQ